MELLENVEVVLIVNYWDLLFQLRVSNVSLEECNRKTSKFIFEKKRERWKR